MLNIKQTDFYSIISIKQIQESKMLFLKTSLIKYFFENDDQYRVIFGNNTILFRKEQLKKLFISYTYINEKNTLIWTYYKKEINRLFLLWTFYQLFFLFKDFNFIFNNMLKFCTFKVCGFVKKTVNLSLQMNFMGSVTPNYLYLLKYFGFSLLFFIKKIKNITKKNSKRKWKYTKFNKFKGLKFYSKVLSILLYHPKTITFFLANLTIIKNLKIFNLLKDKLTYFLAATLRINNYQIFWFYFYILFFSKKFFKFIGRLKKRIKKFKILCTFQNFEILFKFIFFYLFWRIKFIFEKIFNLHYIYWYFNYFQYFYFLNYYTGFLNKKVFNFKYYKRIKQIKKNK